MYHYVVRLLFVKLLSKVYIHQLTLGLGYRRVEHTVFFL